MNEICACPSTIYGRAESRWPTTEEERNNGTAITSSARTLSTQVNKSECRISIHVQNLFSQVQKVSAALPHRIMYDSPTRPHIRFSVAASTRTDSSSFLAESIPPPPRGVKTCSRVALRSRDRILAGLKPACVSMPKNVSRHSSRPFNQLTSRRLTVKYANRNWLPFATHKPVTIHIGGFTWRVCMPGEGGGRHPTAPSLPRTPTGYR